MTNNEAVTVIKAYRNNLTNSVSNLLDGDIEAFDMAIAALEERGECKNCKFFEYDTVAKVDGIPLIVGHEICHKWGDGCKTSENGYCFLYEGKGKE